MKPEHWIALGAMILAAMTYLLSYRERLASLRSQVHARQVALVEEFYRVVGRLEQQASIVAHQDVRRVIDVRNEELAESVFQLLSLTMAMPAFMPDEVVDSLISVATAATNLVQDAVFDGEKYYRLSTDLRDEMFKSYSVIRKELGIDTLSRQTFDMINLYSTKSQPGR